MLELSKVTKIFGGLKANHRISFAVGPKDVVGLIGPNGAGKTTLFNVLSGYLRATSGRITFQGVDITNRKPYEVAGYGLVRTFQENILFHEFSVFENVLIGCHLHPRVGFLSEIVRSKQAKRKQYAVNYKIQYILELMGLNEIKDELAKNLSHGHQRGLGVAIALAAEPKILMMDEPFGGMNAQETQMMMERVKRIHSEKEIAVVLIEHDMRAVMGLCNNIVVLNFGEKIAEGSPQEVCSNPSVVEAYLGTENHVV